MSPDIEQIVSLHADAILLSPFENSGGYGRLEKLGIPIISEDEFLEMIGYNDDVTASDGSAVGSDDKKPQEPKQLSLF